MTTPREPTVRELQELLQSAVSDVALLRWQLDAVTEAAARLEADVEPRIARVERQATAPVDDRRLPERVTQTVDWTAEQRAIVEARKRRR